ncbi:molecular chaperone DnaJ [Salpingoeca rosetta]|uniref:DnaJ homolog subfamily C member 10 n=1 Tax=Salpingoeca rosetta (strain ATCC 50818 / BSB-021) TaxID=946362 RepID=F2UBN2_SALR5|nr:molecular chaperone DnaJ [Salpingoeca rosetta]EGD73898.1 molecular chaperone DnaJ [Salpingoeca rosetta]|eukprot:XP_004993461.1 molecular chaperone DnaJ [Salpingoeca rosetta]
MGAAKAVAALVLLLLVAVAVHVTEVSGSSQTYYELLEVNVEASPKEIRRSFKKLALRLHPDKNPGDPEAHDKFVQLNAAFEVLKDPKLRKIYDEHGEHGVKEAQEGGGNGPGTRQRGGFHSWQYYKDMSLYDDEEDVETFAQKDFWSLAVDSGDTWFVNFYSPGCSHCRDLAPTWKQFAHVLRDAVGVGAINCEEFWNTCQQLHIRAFPTLLLFHKGDGSYTPYRGRARDIESLTAFVERHLPPPLAITALLTPTGHLTSTLHRPLAIAACVSPTTDAETHECVDLALRGKQYPVLLLRRSEAATDYEVFHGDLHPSIVERWISTAKHSRVQTFTPHLFPDLLFDQQFTLVFIDFFAPWCGPCQQMLPAWREASVATAKEPGVVFGSVDCHAYADLCRRFTIHSYPSPIAYLHGTGTPTPFHGNFMSAGALRDFVQATLHPAVIELDAHTFQTDIKQSDEHLWVVDFFAPWCGHCQRLAPEFARAAHNLRGVARLATVDCTREKDLCRQQHVRAYPTVRVYLPGRLPRRVLPYRGHHAADWITAAVREHLPNKVKTMSGLQLDDAAASSDALLLVTFGAPWCRPCLEFKPIFNHVALLLADSPDLAPWTIEFGSIDCQRYRFKCNQLRLPHYPISILFIPGQGNIMIEEQDPEALMRIVIEAAQEAAPPPAVASDGHNAHDEL